MSYEMTVAVGERRAKAFLQGGFYQFTRSSMAIHKHKYAEIHVVAGGSMRFSVDGRPFDVGRDDAFCIPGATFHNCLKIEDVVKTVFQTDLELPEFSIVKLPEGVAGGLIDAIQTNGSLLPSYLSLVCSAFARVETEPVPISDRAFIIDEFFARHYHKDVTCGDLAKELCLSRKQTERLVEKYTGNNFRGEIVKRRLEAARRLELETGGKLSQSEIAQRVGYQSYSGFWKARKAICDTEERGKTYE